MSNDVLGFVEFLETPNDEVITCVEKDSILGIQLVERSELTTFFPEEIHPTEDRSSCFMVSDSKSSKNASYLIDGIDYAEDTEIKLPIRSKDRLELLVRDILKIYHSSSIVKMAVSLTECSQVESTVECHPDNLFEKICIDMEEASPPDIIYVLGKKLSWRS